MEQNILIIGAGPTGLGAGWRLQELGHSNWRIVEQHTWPGGLAASFQDPQGFTWDIGGHVIFSHFRRFDRLVEAALGSEYLEHQRESWVRLLNRWIPYPFQNNLRYLPRETLFACLQGLLTVLRASPSPAAHFEDWILQTFGQGIADCFMWPYNRKVWATPLHQMSQGWIAERVAVVDLERVLRNVILELDDISWGPNNTFRFPLKGGTGTIFRRTAQRFSDHIDYGRRLTGVDTVRRQVRFEDGGTLDYDALISTVPLNDLVAAIESPPDAVTEAATRLTANRGLVVGVGFNRSDPATRCWMYFPEDLNPCYRVTQFSNYSPSNVPHIDSQFSLMGEISFPKHKHLDTAKAVAATLQGYVKTGLIDETDQDRVASVYTLDIENSYPVPTLERDAALQVIQPWLESHAIYSRGRFGAWKYEISNMDHSVVQGMEVVDRLLRHQPERVFC